MRARAQLGLISAVALAWLAAGCATEEPIARDLGTRAVVIAIDGADWRIIEDLAAEGGMENLMSLRERGVWGPIETLHDIPLSPVIWTSVATGRGAVDHGISWFMVDRPGGGKVPVRSTNRKVKAIWNILGEHDRRSTTIGWWATYPAEDVGPGTMVSDALGYHGFGSTAREGDDGRKTWPAERYAELAPLVPPVESIGHDYASRYIAIAPEEYEELMYLPGRDERLDASIPIHLFQQYASTAEGYTAIAERLLSEPFDLFLVYFEQVDSFSHLFMKYAPPRLEWIDEEPYERYRNLVREWYLKQDEILGRLLARIDLETTAVFVVSDHGFKSDERRIRSQRTIDVNKAHLDHESDGIFIATGPGIRSGETVDGASVIDLAPTLLHYLGFPVAENMSGRVLGSVFEASFMAENPVRKIATYEEPDAGATGGGEAGEGGTGAGYGNRAGGDAADGPGPGVGPGGGPAAGVGATGSDVDEEQMRANLEALEALGYIDSAEEAAAAGEESSPQIHTNLGRVHLSAGDFAKAQAEFEKALALDPTYADALLNISQVHRLQGRLAQAEHFIERAIATDPNSIGALAQLAEIKRDQGQLDEAIRLFHEALSIDDSFPFVFLGLGDVLQRAGRFEEAVEAFESVLALDPDSFKAYYNLGVTYSNMGRLAESIASYEKALELSPDHPEAGLAHNNLGAIHQARGEIDEAQERYESAVAVAPYHLESRYNLAVIYLAQNRVDEAVELLEQAAQIEPNHEHVATRLGWAYLQQARNQEAFKALLLVRRLYPRNWEANLGLALLYAASDQEDRARQALGDAIASGGAPVRQRAAQYTILEPYL
jgi:tetratricopeptide (TPR) repeat protein